MLPRKGAVLPPWNGRLLTTGLPTHTGGHELDWAMASAEVAHGASVHQPQAIAGTDRQLVAVELKRPWQLQLGSRYLGPAPVGEPLTRWPISLYQALATPV